MTNKILSVFIDESGDFGAYDSRAPYYIVTMIFHNQSVDINEDIAAFDTHIHDLGYETHAVHVGPLIRRESIYLGLLMEDRKRLFNALFHFTRRLDIKYTCFKIKKAECKDVIALTSRISKAIAASLRNNYDFLDKFEQIIIYYDNGQVELTKILTSVFNSMFFNVEFRKVRPIDYKLFQAADLICTLELIYEKASANLLSRSETDFFGGIRDYKKNYYKHILKKRI